MDSYGNARRQTAENAALMWALTETPSLTSETLAKPKAGSWELDLEREKQLADDLAFLVCIWDDPTEVRAVCKEEDQNGSGITIRIATNTGDPSRTVLELQVITDVMAQAARGRGKANDSTASARAQAEKLNKAFEALERCQNREETVHPLEALIVMAYTFDTQGLTATLKQHVKLNQSLVAYLPEVIGKLGRYVWISFDLTNATRMKHVALFHRIKVAKVTFQQVSPRTSTVRAKPFARHGPEWSAALQISKRRYRAYIFKIGVNSGLPHPQEVEGACRNPAVTIL
ncbi:hypothetical protein LTR35_018015 [Friedmanniomyces endolithicus]|nr:hypothetical protein LTR35_018015 [Friedmanniomyces endolithicus]KAK0969644.1 hypothetical protein LTR54_018074 [Friedmanniomyces endolithicus]